MFGGRARPESNGARKHFHLTDTSGFHVVAQLATPNMERENLGPDNELLSVASALAPRWHLIGLGVLRPSDEKADFSVPVNSCPRESRHWLHSRSVQKLEFELLPEPSGGV